MKANIILNKISWRIIILNIVWDLDEFVFRFVEACTFFIIPLFNALLKSSNDDIFASEKTLRRIVKYYLSTGAVTNKKSLIRSINLMKISPNQLNELDNLIEENKETTALQARNLLNLRVSTRTVQNYLRRLGWRRIVTRFCQFVSSKNRAERIIFCNFCVLTKETFDYSIFIDKWFL